VESGPCPVYAVRRMTYMEGMADELGGDEDEEEEEEEDEDGNKKEKAPKPEDPLVSQAEAERILSIKRREVRGEAADKTPVLSWEKMQTTQDNPKAAEKKDNPTAATLLSTASCLHGKYAALAVGPKIFYFFDKPSRCGSVQERVVTLLDTERVHITRHLIIDPRIPTDCEMDIGFGQPAAVAVDGNMFVFGGSPIEQQQVLRMDPLSFATTSLDYEGDEAFPACDFADAIVGCVGGQLMVLAGDLTGGWGSLRVLDTTQIKLEPEATEEQPDVFGKWHTVITEAEVPPPCGPGERKGVFIGHELWVVTACEERLEVHVLDTEKMYWHKAPVTGLRPPHLRHFDAISVGRQIHVLGGQLSKLPTPAFKGEGFVYDSGHDYLYSLNMDRCEWTQKHCHGQIPADPVHMAVAATESDVWVVAPTLDAKTWWRAGAPTLPENYPENKSVKATKFGALQSVFLLPKVVYPPEDTGDLRDRTWQPPAAPTKWEDLEDREYLNRTVWPILQHGLTLLEKERPNRPVRALAEFLLSHNTGAPL